MTDAALTRPGHETGYGSAGYRAYVLSALLVVYIFNFIDRSIFAILTEPMKTSLQLEDWHMGVLGGLAFAIFYTGGSVAGATGPLISGFVGDAVGLPIALTIVSCIALTTVPMVWALRPAFR